ncbi:MAG: hypothetical protein K8R54_19010, partial [Bacteroidales bacterium]|nr:hypothetical protein [Bacteroidales bacterium]
VGTFFDIEKSCSNWYDYGARFYDPQLGRWHVPDQLAEEAYTLTPYRYGFNNPMSFTDPNGMFEDWIITGTDGNQIRVVMPGTDVYFHLDVPLGESATIDPLNSELKDFAFGYQTTLSGDVSGHIKSSGGGFINRVIFFDETYGGYWYSFAGGQWDVGAGLPSISVDAEKSFLLGIRHKDGESGPIAFSGNYNLVTASAGLKGNVEIDVFAQYSMGQDWDVIEIGASAGLDLVPGPDGSLTAGKGSSVLLDKQTPTSERRTWDKISNHILYNPYVKMLYRPWAPFD